MDASASALPYDLWRGVDAVALERLLDATPLPSPSPTLAALIARALAADDGGNGNLALRAAALQRAGRVEETISLLGKSPGVSGPGLEARYAMALFAAGREAEACAVDLGDRRGAEARLISAYCSADRGRCAGTPRPGCGPAAPVVNAQAGGRCGGLCLSQARWT